MKMFYQVFKTMAIFIICHILVSCASVGVTVTKQYPAKLSNCQLDIYTSPDEITKEYEVVCLIDSKTGSTAFSKKTIANAIELAKPKACESGADALLIVAGNKVGMGYGRVGEATATIKGIKYKLKQ